MTAPTKPLKHKPEKDVKIKNKQLAQSKRENHRLKKEVARLRREVEKTDFLREDHLDESSDPEYIDSVGNRICPKCGTGQILTLLTPGGVIASSCNQCHERY